jgi:hypothetical protein
MAAEVYASTPWGNRLSARRGMLLWTQADPSVPESHAIVAARGDHGQILVPGLAFEGAPRVPVLATDRHVIWFDGRAIGVLAGGEVRHVDDATVPWLACLATDAERAYFGYLTDAGSAIAEVDLDGSTLRPIARVAGRIDRLVAIGGHVAWTCAGGHELFAQPIAGGAPALVYTAAEPFALGALDDAHLVVAVGQGLVRIAIATGEVTTFAGGLAPGAPSAVACHGDHVYVARHAPEHGSMLERVVVASGVGELVHASAEAVRGLVATEAGVYWLEGEDLLTLPPDAPALTTHAEPDLGAVAVEVTADGTMRATFAAAVDRCGALARRIAAESPRCVHLVCDGGSPNEAFAHACRGHAFASVRELICDVPWRAVDGNPTTSIGPLADVLGAMPALERAFVTADPALAPFRHDTLVELHLGTPRLDPGLAPALAASHLPGLERVAFAIPKISTAALLALVKALVKLDAPRLAELHLGALRGPDQIRDVVGLLADRGRPESWTTLAFAGVLPRAARGGARAFGDEDAMWAILDALAPPPGLSVAISLDGYSQRRRKKWLVDPLAWHPCDPSAYDDW